MDIHKDGILEHGYHQFMDIHLLPYIEISIYGT